MKVLRCFRWNGLGVKADSLAGIPEGWWNLAGGEERQRRYPRNRRPPVPTPAGSRKPVLVLAFPAPLRGAAPFGANSPPRRGSFRVFGRAGARHSSFDCLSSTRFQGALHFFPNRRKSTLCELSTSSLHLVQRITKLSSDESFVAIATFLADLRCYRQ